MPYTSITKTNRGREAIAYAQDGNGHDGSEVRNAEVGCVNLAMGIDFADQMQVFWDKAIRRHKCQIMRIIQSFALEELDPNNPHDIHTANLIGQTFARKYYPGRQSVVFTQIDGDGGKIHNHVLVSDVHMETHKGHTDDQSKYSKIEEWTDEIAENYIGKIRNPRKENQQAKDKVTRTERTKREQGKYVWKDSLKSRIRGAMEEANDEADFYLQLKKRGVTAEKKESKKQGTYFTYSLDKKYIPRGEKVPSNLSARSYKLGADFGYDALQYMVETKRNRIKKQQVRGTIGVPEQIENEQKEPAVKRRRKQKKEPRIQGEYKQNDTKTVQQSEEEKVRQELFRWLDYRGLNFISRHDTPDEWETEFNRLHAMFKEGQRAPEGWKKGDPIYVEERDGVSDPVDDSVDVANADPNPQMVELPNTAAEIIANAAADNDIDERDDRRLKLWEKMREQQKKQTTEYSMGERMLPDNYIDVLHETISRNADRNMDI